MKHTAGQWRTSKKFDEITVSKPGILEGSKSIAMLSDFSKSKEEVKANAILMAAAPNLLKTLSQLVNLIQGCRWEIADQTILQGEIFIEAKRIIKKATS